MAFKEALKKLNIEDYERRIFHSNSHGELFHCWDYVIIAELSDDLDWFREWFIAIVEEAKESWKRPESVFQHIARILKDGLNTVQKKREEE